MKAKTTRWQLQDYSYETTTTRQQRRDIDNDSPCLSDKFSTVRLAEDLFLLVNPRSVKLVFCWNPNLPPKKTKTAAAAKPLLACKLLKEFSKDVGAPDVLVCDLAKTQKKREVRDFCTQISTTLQILEAET